MIPQHALQTLRDREVEIRSTSEDERRRRAELERADGDPYAMDAEIRVLIERATHEACCDCETELTQEAGFGLSPRPGRA